MAGEVRFIGRTAELAKLDAAAALARAGEGRAVLIGGEAGIGKTRLAEEALRRLEAAGFLALRGRCLPGAPAPYLPVFEALKSGGLQHMLALQR
ncbi:MAG TPA: ATP-binding protein, partial [Candidatus Thermoplasmatota archaeon]|nr:ATP-binding protein [Candidatus Thermoplasmatota archaeon]